MPRLRAGSWERELHPPGVLLPIGAALGCLVIWSGASRYKTWGCYPLVTIRCLSSLGVTLLVFLIKIMTDHKVKSEFIIYVVIKIKTCKSGLDAICPIWLPWCSLVLRSQESRSLHSSTLPWPLYCLLALCFFSLAPNSFIQMEK